MRGKSREQGTGQQQLRCEGYHASATRTARRTPYVAKRSPNSATQRDRCNAPASRSPQACGSVQVKLAWYPDPAHGIKPSGNACHITSARTEAARRGDPFADAARQSRGVAVFADHCFGEGARRPVRTPVTRHARATCGCEAVAGGAPRQRNEDRWAHALSCYGIAEYGDQVRPVQRTGEPVAAGGRLGPSEVGVVPRTRARNPTVRQRVSHHLHADR